MTIVLTKGAPSNLAAAELATIVEYRASGRVAYLAASSVTTLPQALDGYAITPTLKRALEDAPRGALTCLVALVSDLQGLSRCTGTDQKNLARRCRFRHSRER